MYIYIHSGRYACQVLKIVYYTHSIQQCYWDFLCRWLYIHLGRGEFVKEFPFLVHSIAISIRFVFPIHFIYIEFGPNERERKFRLFLHRALVISGAYKGFFEQAALFGTNPFTGRTWMCYNGSLPSPQKMASMSYKQVCVCVCVCVRVMSKTWKRLAVESQKPTTSILVVVTPHIQVYNITVPKWEKNRWWLWIWLRWIRYVRFMNESIGPTESLNVFTTHINVRHLWVPYSPFIVTWHAHWILRI